MLVTTGLAAMQGLVPTLGRIQPVELAAGAELPPDDLADRLVALGYSRTDVVEHRGEFAVRGGVLDVFPGTARRPVRLEYWGDEIESLREFAASSQLSSGPRRARPRPAGARAHRRRRAPGARGRARAQVPRPLPRRPPADRGRAPRRGRRVVRAAAVRPAADARRAAAAPARGSWSRRRAGPPTAPGRRSRREPRSPRRPSGPARRRWSPLEEALGGATRAAPHRVHRGDRPRPDALGDGAGQSRRAREARGRPAPPGGIALVVAAAGRGSLERAREVLGSAAGEAVEAPAAERVRLRGRARGGRDGGGPVRRAAAHADRPAAHLAPPGRHRGGARAGRLRRPPGPRRRPVRRHPAPRDRRLRARLPGPRVRAGRPAVRPVGLGRHGGALRRRRRAAAHRLGSQRLGPRDRPGEARRQGHGRRARPPLLGPDVREGHAFGPDTPWQGELEDAFPHEETRDQLTAIDEVKADMRAAQADGPPDLRRRRLRQDGDRRARRVQGRDGREAGGRPGADHAAGRAALHHVLRAVRAVPGQGRDALAVRVDGRAGPRSSRT